MSSASEPINGILLYILDKIKTNMFAARETIPNSKPNLQTISLKFAQIRNILEESEKFKEENINEVLNGSNNEGVSNIAKTGLNSITLDSIELDEGEGTDKINYFKLFRYYVSVLKMKDKEGFKDKIGEIEAILNNPDLGFETKDKFAISIKKKEADTEKAVSEYETAVKEIKSIETDIESKKEEFKLAQDKQIKTSAKFETAKIDLDDANTILNKAKETLETQKTKKGDLEKEKDTLEKKLKVIEKLISIQSAKQELQQEMQMISKSDISVLDKDLQSLIEKELGTLNTPNDTNTPIDTTKDTLTGKLTQIKEELNKVLISVKKSEAAFEEAQTKVDELEQLKNNINDQKTIDDNNVNTLGESLRSLIGNKLKKEADIHTLTEKKDNAEEIFRKLPKKSLVQMIEELPSLTGGGGLMKPKKSKKSKKSKKPKKSKKSKKTKLPKKTNLPKKTRLSKKIKSKKSKKQ